MSKKFIPGPRYEVLKFGAVSLRFASDSGFAAHRKVELAQIFFCLKADGKSLILGFEIFGFGPSKAELRRVQKTPICITFSTFGKNIGF